MNKMTEWEMKSIYEIARNARKIEWIKSGLNFWSRFEWMMIDGIDWMIGLWNNYRTKWNELRHELVCFGFINEVWFNAEIESKLN